MIKRFRRVSYAFDSLLGEVLLWILILLMFLWAMSVIMTYHVADTIAQRPYDDLLAEHVRNLTKFVHVDPRRTTVSVPASVGDILHSDAKDRLYYQVLAPDGSIVFGDKEIPWEEPPEHSDAGEVRFRDDEIAGEDVRVAYVFLLSNQEDHPVLIQAAETRNKRTALVASIISGVIVPQFVIVPMAVMLVYLALSKGITPLQRLQEELRQRRPTDLSPISVKGIPAEISPMLVALNDVMVRLEEHLMGQRQFIADAAHQLKTPLTGLRMQTELALHETDAGHLRERLQAVVLSAERLTHLTHQLLSLARAEATTESSDAFQPVDLNSLAHEVTGEWAVQAIAKGIDLGFEPADSPAPVVGSSFLLREMLGNLVDNAIKYTPSGGQVVVRVKAEASISLLVEDTGIGISIGERKQVFERFYRVLGTGADGSGLGLAIVQEIAELHRATVRLSEGNSGVGTSVTVAFSRAGDVGMTVVAVSRT